MQRGSKLLCLLLVVAVAFLSSACQLTPTFTTGYEFESNAMRPSPVGGRLAVLTFEEARAPRYYSSAGRLFLTYLPIVPFVSMPFERVDESVQIQSEAIERGGSGMTSGAKQNVAPPFETYYYPNSFSTAVARDLAETGLFESVEHVGDSLSEEEAAAYRYVLSGKLNASELRHTTTSFGLGFVGVLLWFLPVPMAKSTGSLDLDLVLTDRMTGEVVWEKKLDESIRRYITLYTSSAMVYGRGGAWSFSVYPPPSDSKVDSRSLFSWHFETLRRSMLEAREEIAAAIDE